MPTLTSQQKKVLAVVSLAFVCLAACYKFITHCYFKAKPMYSDQQLLQIIACESTAPAYPIAQAYFDLACKPHGGHIKLLNGNWTSGAELLFKSLELKPNKQTEKKLNELKKNLLEIIDRAPNAQACFDLACIVRDMGPMMLLNGEWTCEFELLEEAIQLDPSFVQAYINFGISINPKYKAKLSNGTVMTRQQFFVKAIELDPKCLPAYLNLVKKFPCNAGIQMLDGTWMTKKDLYIKIIELDPKNAKAYFKLGLLLAPHDSVLLLDGTSLTTQEIENKAAQLEPHYAKFYALRAQAPFAKHSSKLYQAVMKDMEE